MYKRIQIIRSLDDLLLREDGITFQRIARRLLSEQLVSLRPHSEHSDLGRDATIELPSGDIVLAASLTASTLKIMNDIEKIKKSKTVRRIIFCTPRVVSNKRVQRWTAMVYERHGLNLNVLERSWIVDSPEFSKRS